MAKPPARRSSIYLRNLDPDIKARFKAFCARRGATMERVLSNAILDLLAREERVALNRVRGQGVTKGDPRAAKP